MDTKLVAVSEETLREAGLLLQRGEVVGMPTETVYGLAANARDGAAVQKIFVAKGRPQDNPLIVHIADREMLPQVARDVPPQAYLLAEAFWPGPLTMVLPKSDTLAAEVSAGLDSAGIRMPAHPAARALIRMANLPLAAPSANLSGSPSPTSAAHVCADMQGRIPMILDGGECAVGLESTVISLVEEPLLLRPGFITQQQLEAALGQPVHLAPAITQPLQAGEAPRSPGMKYRHYAPKAQLTLVEGPLAAFAAYMERHNEPGVWALCFDGEEPLLPLPALSYGPKEDDAAQGCRLFAALRQLDENDARKVYVRSPSHTGVGLAVYNRLLRAAGFRVKAL